MTTTQVKKNQETAPTALAGTAQASGGTFTAGTYFWKVTGTGPYGESVPSAELSKTIAANGSCDLVFGVFPQKTNGIRVYRGTSAGAENRLVADMHGNRPTWTDTGAPGVAGTPPATAAWGALAKTGTVPDDSNIPAGTPSGFGQQMRAAMTAWLVTGGTGTLALTARKMMLAAGFDIQEA